MPPLVQRWAQLFVFLAMMLRRSNVLVRRNADPRFRGRLGPGEFLRRQSLA